MTDPIVIEPETLANLRDAYFIVIEEAAESPLCPCICAMTHQQVYRQAMRRTLDTLCPGLADQWEKDARKEVTTQ